MAKMAMKLSVKGFRELAESAGDPALTREAIQRVMQTATSEGQREATERAHSTLVANSMLAEATGSLGRVYSTLPQAQAAAIDRGRKPGGRIPPIDVVTAWAQRRGVDAEAVLPIARAIARRGIKGRFFMRGARKVMRDRLPVLLAVAGEEIVAGMAQATQGATWTDTP